MTHIATERILMPSVLIASLAVLVPTNAVAQAEAKQSVVGVVVEEAANSKTIRIQLLSNADESAVSTFVMDDNKSIAMDIVDVEMAKDWREQSSMPANIGTEASFLSSIDTTRHEDNNGFITRIIISPNSKFEHEFKVVGNQIVMTMTASLDESLTDAGVDLLAAELSAPKEIVDSDSSAKSELRKRSETAQKQMAKDVEDFIPSSELRSKRASGPQELPAGPSVTSVDYSTEDSTAKVVIGTKALAGFTHSRPRPDTILVDVDNAFVPKSLERVLDTSNFYSPVKMVRAYRTSKGARIAITVNADSEYTVSKSSNGFLLIDVPIPENMRVAKEQATQQSSSVAPESSSEGISNAYQNEILIGEQGNTINPQAAFGNGAGSNDPASMLGMATGFMYDTSSASSQKYTGKRISLDFVNADIHSIFRIISHVSKLNIVTGDDVSGKVTVRLENVPWDQALAAVLQAKGLGSQRFGNIIRVAPIDTIKAEQQSAVEAKRAQEELTELQLLVIPLNYSQASDLSEQVSELLSDRGTLQIDTRGNQFIIKETEKRLAQIRELIRHLDKQTPQVLIEARVVEASSTFSSMLGVQWGAEVNASALTGYSTGLFFPNSIGVSGGLTPDGAEAYYSSGQDTLLVDLGAEASTSGVAFSLGSIPGLINLDARLSAMETDGWGKVVSEPRITTLDNEPAKISQGARVPFLSTSSGGTQVQFVDAMLEMQVTPHITNDDHILLDLMVSNNRPDFSQLVQGQPAIIVKEAATNVLVSDGDTTVIGGVFSSESSENQDRVPGLHYIPILGSLFKNSSESLARNELIVFITPRIVTRTAVGRSN